MKKLFILSRYKESYDWIYEYTDDYLVYNKGLPLIDHRVKNIENIGGNQRDIFHFIHVYYENLPDIMIFIQAYPFDHCKKEVFDQLIQNEKFTPLEYYGMIPANAWEGRTIDGGYMEINNSWYISASNNTHNQTCRYGSYDEFMDRYFENYVHLDWLRFSPGSQYIITKEQGLQYPKNFWESMMHELDVGRLPTEGHIIERALYYILTGQYKLRKDYYGK